jgi:hypothetical protein
MYQVNKPFLNGKYFIILVYGLIFNNEVHCDRCDRICLFTVLHSIGKAQRIRVCSWVAAYG